MNAHPKLWKEKSGTPKDSSFERWQLRSGNTKVVTLALIAILAVALTTIIYFTCFQPSSNATFSVVWITDTQNIVSGYSAEFDSMCSWIAKNSASLNLKAVIHTGDIVNVFDNADQWENANHSMGILLDSNIPYCWTAGNHDKTDATWYGSNCTTFDVGVVRQKEYWLSDYHEGTNTDIVFGFRNQTFLILDIEYLADTEVLQWANNMLDLYPSSLAIIGTHSYLSPSCNYDQWGIDFRTNVLDPHENVILTLNGHENSLGNRTKWGNRNELMFCREDEDLGKGGATVRILTFDLTERTIEVTTYLPYENKFIDDSRSQFKLSNAIPDLSPVLPPSLSP